MIGLLFIYLLEFNAGLGTWLCKGLPRPHLATGGWAYLHVPPCPALSTLDSPKLAILSRLGLGPLQTMGPGTLCQLSPRLDGPAKLRKCRNTSFHRYLSKSQHLWIAISSAITCTGPVRPRTNVHRTGRLWGYSQLLHCESTSLWA